MIFNIEPICVTDTITQLEEHIESGLIFISRDNTDDPVIIGTWL